MIDFRKLHGASEAVLRKFSATELYLKRARKTVAKMMRLQWTQDFDIETLEARGHWATMEELLEVVKFHLPRNENTVKICKSSPAQVNPSDLTLATKFVAMYLFIKVKGSRPMTYQYLTVEMIATAKEKDGLRACLHGGGGPQVGEVTRLAVVEKWLVFTCKLTTPGPGVTLLDVVAWSLGMKTEKMAKEGRILAASVCGIW